MGAEVQTKVKRYFKDRSFGFLDNGGGPDIFVSKKELTNCQYLKPGVSVEFECFIENDKLVAKKVKLLNRPSDSQPIHYVMT